jgi:hypothetical protein
MAQPIHLTFWKHPMRQGAQISRRIRQTWLFAFAALLLVRGSALAQVSPSAGGGTIEWVPKTTHFPQRFGEQAGLRMTVDGELIGWYQGQNLRVTFAPLAASLAKTNAMNDCVLFFTSDGQITVATPDGKYRVLGRVPSPRVSPTFEVSWGMGSYLSKDGSAWVASCESLVRTAGLYRDAAFLASGQGLLELWGGGLAYSPDRGRSLN